MSNQHATTPEWVLSLVRRVAPIEVDPFWNPNAKTTLGLRFDGSEGKDGLHEPWGKGLAYVNPPYERGFVDKVRQKMVLEASKGCEIIALLKADPSTKWFRKLVKEASACVILSKRVRFGPHNAGADFPSAVFYIGDRTGRFKRVFWDHGVWISCGDGALNAGSFMSVTEEHAREW